MKLLAGKVAIVTGAGGGLGRSHALALAAFGAKVVVNDPGVARDGSGGGTKMADTVVEEIKKAGGEAVGNYDSVATTEGAENIIKTAVEAFGQVDILINNAGILRDKTLLNTTDDMWDLVMDVHMRGTFACTRAAAKVMREKKTGGRIINTTSVAGLKGNFGQANYSSAKAGIYGFTLTAAMELAKDNITVNAIAPLAKTRMTADIDSIPDDWKPEDVSNLVCYLVSDKASDVNGRVIGVHGKHLFEYKMTMTDGRQGSKEWTLDEIHEWIHTPEVKVALPPSVDHRNAVVERIFEVLASGFTAERAEDWNTVIHFAVAPSGDWTVTIKDKVCTVTAGKPASAKTIVTVEGATLVGMIEGRVNPSMAFMTGKIKTTNMQDLTKFGKVFHFKKIAEMMKGGTPQPTKPAEVKSASLDKLIGKKFHGSAIVVHPEKISLYDTTVGDKGSPIFPVTLSKELFFKLIKDPDFTADLGRLVHGEQAMRFYKPIKAWDIVSPRGEVVTVEEKPSGQIIVFRQKLYCEGELMVEMDSTLFIRGESAGSKASKPAVSFDGEVFYDTTIPSDLPAKYAVASGDDNLIHTDKNFAQSVGFKDVILHGLGTLALVSKELPKDMKSLKVRFAKPVYPGDKISAKSKSVDGHVEFMATNDNGDVVLTNGVVE
jgi:NAD(P)-dependent dehydrogenase (short-subunit alcohol dehydrogenase family)/acyl dehydratase/putative sterol carrier protein